MLLCAALFVACSGKQGLDRRRGPEYSAELASWQKALTELGGNGKWVVSRGYHAGDDAVAMATQSPLSHVSIIDAERGQLIEAIGKGVVSTPTDKFIDDTHHMLIIEPEGWNPDFGMQALKRARDKIGVGYDYLGILGLPDDDRFYCSELAAWSVGIKVDRKGPSHVLHPRDMHRYGQVLFDSGERDTVPDYPQRRK
jgi:hypothetical protein